MQLSGRASSKDRIRLVAEPSLPEGRREEEASLLRVGLACQPGLLNLALAKVLEPDPNIRVVSANKSVVDVLVVTRNSAQSDAEVGADAITSPAYLLILDVRDNRLRLRAPMSPGFDERVYPGDLQTLVRLLAELGSRRQELPQGQIA
jgi:hypothetical protein